MLYYRNPLTLDGQLPPPAGTPCSSASMDAAAPRYERYILIDSQLLYTAALSGHYELGSLAEHLNIRAAQIFRGLMLQTPNLKLVQTVKVYQVSSPSEVILPCP